MTPADVATLIDRQIAAGWDPDSPRQNPHGVELKRCLVVPPERRTFLDSFNSNQPIDLWLVLREDPDSKDGYEVVFCEEEGEFGLAVPDGNKPGTLIGIYGSFPETLASM
ncbi:MAG: hypothetical protein O2894_07930 [Planctomycetota bacterium]|nr:hypothetical protein [Planctomycetota bacterium]